MVTILEATLHLVPEPAARTLVVLGYPSIYEAGDHMEEILKFEPSGLEGIDHLLVEWLQQKGEDIDDIKLLPEGQGFLLVEFSGDSKEDADAQARRCMEELNGGIETPRQRPLHEEEVTMRSWLFSLVLGCASLLTVALTPTESKAIYYFTGGGGPHTGTVIPTSPIHLITTARISDSAITSRRSIIRVIITVTTVPRTITHRRTTITITAIDRSARDR